MKTNVYTRTSALFLLIFLVVSMAQAQYLEVTNTSNGKVRKIKAKQTFSFKYSEDDDYKKSKIQSFTDSSVVLFTPEEDDIQLREVKLKDIYAIKKISCLHKTGYAVGAVLIVGGAGTMAESSAIAGDDGSIFPPLLIGAGTVIVGLIPYLIPVKEFVQGKNATYKIVVSGK